MHITTVAGWSATDQQTDRRTDRECETFRDNSVTDSQDSEELLEDSRAGLLLPGAPHHPGVIEVEAGLLPLGRCRVLYHPYIRPIPASPHP